MDEKRDYKEKIDPFSGEGNIYGLIYQLGCDKRKVFGDILENPLKYGEEIKWE